MNAGATNPSNRYLVAGSYKVSDTFSPQLLIYGGVDIPPQVGLNLSTVIGESTVVYGEVAVGKGIRLICPGPGGRAEPTVGSSAPRSA